MSLVHHICSLHQKDLPACFTDHQSFYLLDALLHRYVHHWINTAKIWFIHVFYYPCSHVQWPPHIHAGQLWLIQLSLQGSIYQMFFWLHSWVTQNNGNTNTSEDGLTLPNAAFWSSEDQTNNYTSLYGCMKSKQATTPP